MSEKRKSLAELFKNYDFEKYPGAEEYDWGPAVGDEFDWGSPLDTGKVYITGDTHRNFQRIHDFCQLKKTCINDSIIILGDAGINFYLNKSDIFLKKSLSDCPITLFCIHGNHEERPFLISTYTEMTWHGGIVYYEEKYPNLLFAKDGEIYDFYGKKCIVIGGAYSIDKAYRLEHDAPWFPSEQPSSEIKTYVENQLDSMNWAVDYVFSHTIAKSYEPTWSFKGKLPESLLDKSTELWLDDIDRKLTYTRWFAGHYHVDDLSPNIRLMFKHIINLDAHDVLHHKDEEVYFLSNKKLKQGNINIIDFYGTFGNPHEVSYDILDPDTNMLYKGILNSNIVVEPTKERLLLLHQEQLSTYLHGIMHKKIDTALSFDDQGWISITELINFINLQKKWAISTDNLDKLIINNPQQRYSYNQVGDKLRANPIPCVDFQTPLNIPTVTPPSELYYGYEENSDLFIQKRGVCLYNHEHYITLASSADIALDIAAREYEHICVCKIHTATMYEDGYLFYQASDDIWLVSQTIPSKYIEFTR